MNLQDGRLRNARVTSAGCSGRLGKMPDDKTGFDSATTRTGMRVLVALLALVCGCCPGAQAAMISLHPSKDNSIYSESDNSNARGELFAGVVVSGGLIRRALLQFDLAAGGIPAGSTVNSVTLSLTMTRINPGKTASLFELHPALAAWGQGTSNGTGTGAQPTANDATWYYRQYDADHWATPGGDIGPVSGTATIGTVVATTSYSFASQPGMVADVGNPR